MTEPTTGSLLVTVATTGRVLDRDGYTLTVQGATPVPIAASGSITLSQVPAGTATLSLTDVAENCQVQGGASVSATITAGGSEQVAFTVICQADRVAFLAPQPTGFALFTERSDGTGRRLLVGPVSLSRIAWSPDGHRIAYTAPAVPGATGGGGHVWVVDTGTGAATRLTTQRFLNTEPTWSPDGTRVVFRSQEQGKANCDLWMMNADGSGANALTQTAGYGLCLRQPDWSPDGTRVAFVTTGLAGSMVLQWVDPATMTFGSAQERSVSSFGANWSPSSSHMTTTSTEWVNGNLVWTVYTVTRDGSAQQRVTHAPGSIYGAVDWVSENRVGYSVHLVDGGQSTYEVWTIGVDGSGLARSPVGAGLDPVWPAWQ